MITGPSGLIVWIRMP